jgi:hypothetical protein
VAIAFVGGVKTSGGGVLSITLSRSVTAGNRLFASSAAYEDLSTPDGLPNTVSDAVDAYTQDFKSTQLAAFGGQNSAALYSTASASTTGSRTMTLTYSASDAFCSGTYFEFSGITTSSAVDKTATNSNAGSTTPDSGTTAATTQADEVVIGVIAVPAASSNVALALPSGFTNIGKEQDANSFIGFSTDYKIVSATGTQQVAWGTMSGSYTWTAMVATYKAAAGGGDVFFGQACL